MKRVLTAVVLIPLVLLVLFKAPLWLFTLVVGAVAMGAAWEYLKLVDAYGVKSMKLCVLLTTAFVYALATGVSEGEGAFLFAYALFVLVAIFPFVAFVGALASENVTQALPRVGMSALAIPYIALTLLCLPILRLTSSGLFLTVFAFAIVWSGDIFAYYAGRNFGKHKLAPRISPGKTWEGTVASFVGSVFLAHILLVDNHQIMDALFRWHLSATSVGLPEMSRNERLMHGIMLGACVNIAAQLGDLVESMIKRGADVKDSGTFLPGHGGILDRIDALLFALPVVSLYSWFVKSYS